MYYYYSWLRAATQANGKKSTDTNAIPGTGNSLVVWDESGHTKFPFSSVILSWGKLWLIYPKLPLILL